MSDPYSTAASAINIPFNPYNQIEALDNPYSMSYQSLQNSLNPGTSVVSTALLPTTSVVPKPITPLIPSTIMPLLLIGGIGLIAVIALSRN